MKNPLNKPKQAYDRIILKRRLKKEYTSNTKKELEDVLKQLKKENLSPKQVENIFSKWSKNKIIDTQWIQDRIKESKDSNEWAFAYTELCKEISSCIYDDLMRGK